MDLETHTAFLQVIAVKLLDIHGDTPFNATAASAASTRAVLLPVPLPAP